MSWLCTECHDLLNGGPRYLVLVPVFTVDGQSGEACCSLCGACHGSFDGPGFPVADPFGTGCSDGVMRLAWAGAPDALLWVPHTGNTLPQHDPCVDDGMESDPAWTVGEAGLTRAGVAHVLP